MAIGRVYKVGVFDTSTPLATGATSTVTTPIPILYGVTAATGDLNISAVRVSCMGAAAFPSNASFVASLNINTGAQAGGQTAVARSLAGASSLAANTVFKTAGGTSAAAITGLTMTTELWAQNLPFTAGANWGEWFTPGFEINIPISTQFALFITASSAGTATTFAGEIEFSE
jgi:hypothetical protein